MAVSSAQNPTPTPNPAPTGEQEYRGMLPDLELATGLEKKQLLAELEGKELFETYLSGPFGTLENPVIVPSVNNSRIVGCVGGDGDLEHHLLWHEVKQGKDTICIECGQVFRLKTTAEPEHHHEDIPEGAIVEDVGNITTVPISEETKAFWNQFQELKKKGHFKE